MTKITMTKMIMPNTKTRKMNKTKGVFLLTTINAIAPVKRVFSVNTYLRISLSHEGVSEVSERAGERSVALWSE